MATKKPPGSHPRKQSKQSDIAKTHERRALSASTKDVDPALAALFASSAGPVIAPSISRFPKFADPSPNPISGGLRTGKDVDHVPEEDAQDEALLEVSDLMPSNSHTDSIKRGIPKQTLPRKERKRKAADEEEGTAATNDDKPSGKRPRRAQVSTATSGANGESESEAIVHESLLKDSKEDELEKSSRTVFLSNLSIEAITSKEAKKTLLGHLSSVFDQSDSSPQSIVSLRFRSVPFSTVSMPKKAAYITKSLMDGTTKSTNGYVVYSSAPLARLAVSKLNGTVVLDRHLRADSVAHPSPVDHRRCVFVGNLGFVDDETVFNSKVDPDGKERVEKRKRTKTPMDVEEGLWRTFGKLAGKVESVRVVRDQATRVGKGIAYVQFYDANSVEAALVLSGKKFPPMLPRELRVSRCKAPHKTARAVERSQQRKVPAASPATNGANFVAKRTPAEQTLAGRSAKLLGRAASRSLGDKKGVKGPVRMGWSERPTAVTREKPRGQALRLPESFVFEGQRAAAADGKQRDSKKANAAKGSRGAKGASSNNEKRRVRRAATWRKKAAGS